MKVRVFVTVGKEERVEEQRKVSRKVSCLKSRTQGPVAAISEKEKTLGTMLLTCNMADQESLGKQFKLLDFSSVSLFLKEYVL